MAADPQWWDQWTQQNPLYHVTAAKNVPSILQHGLIPWDDRGNPNSHGWEDDPQVAPRPGHVYLGTANKAKGAWNYVDGQKVLLRINPSKINTQNINPDEDAFNEWSPNIPKGFPTIPGDAGPTYGEYANDIGLFKPEHTQHSAEKIGSVAHYGTVPPEAISVENQNWDGYFPTERSSNILDPIHDCLDERVFDDACAPEPKLKPVHAKWIEKTVISTLKKNGYSHMEDWLTLILTGSLTTYQYSDESDIDISLFVDTEHFPEWSRAEMIGVMVGEVDGTKLPGTPFPLQCFVVPPGIKPQDLYKPGLRSGWDIQNKFWIIPPEKGRVHNVQSEMNGAYTIALENADKMERLLKYEPDKAVMFYHQIHKRRSRDQRAGKGDYSDSNIVYKFLANRGLMPQIADVSGEYIASLQSSHEVRHDNSDKVGHTFEPQHEAFQSPYTHWQFQTPSQQDYDDGKIKQQYNDHSHNENTLSQTLVPIESSDPSFSSSQHQFSSDGDLNSNDHYTPLSWDFGVDNPQHTSYNNLHDRQGDSLRSVSKIDLKASQPYNENRFSYKLNKSSWEISSSEEFPEIAQVSGEYIAKIAELASPNEPGAFPFRTEYGESTYDYSAPWKPGNLGKGILTKSGEVHLWKTNPADEPHHIEGIEGLGIDPDTVIHYLDRIESDGTTRFDPGYVKHHDAMRAAGLKPQEDWTFANTSAIITSDEETSSAHQEAFSESVRGSVAQKLAQGDEEAQVEFPSLTEAQEIHDQALENYGQPYASLLHPDRLEGALGRATNHWYYGQGSNAERIANAAGALAHGIGAAQAFEDGNKRTAYHTSRYFLHNNGYGHISPVTSDDEELADHLVGHGEKTHTLEDTQQMFRNRANVDNWNFSKVAATSYFVDHRAVEMARQHLGLKQPVQVITVPGTAGGYAIPDESGTHQIQVVNWLRPERASSQIWHELTHAQQYERDPTAYKAGLNEYSLTHAKGHDEYAQHPWELEATQTQMQHPFPLALPTRTASIIPEHTKIPNLENLDIFGDRYPIIYQPNARDPYFDDHYWEGRPEHDTPERLLIGKPGQTHSEVERELPDVHPVTPMYHGAVENNQFNWYGNPPPNHERIMQTISQEFPEVKEITPEEKWYL